MFRIEWFFNYIEKYRFEVIEVKICTTEGQTTTEGKMCELWSQLNCLLNFIVTVDS